MNGATLARSEKPPYRAPLIEAARDGDATAIRELLVVCQPDIRRYARRNCRSDHVDDAVQDALFILHRQIGTLRVLAAFSSWLFEIVKRECQRHARLAMRSAGTADQTPDEAQVLMRPAEELRLDLAAAIQSLPEHYRAVMLKRDIEEMTIEEIAQSLGLTRESAKARLHRARAMVREYLKD